jgi:hypothetical protein
MTRTHEHRAFTLASPSRFAPRETCVVALSKSGNATPRAARMIFAHTLGNLYDDRTRIRDAGHITFERGMHEEREGNAKRASGIRQNAGVAK